MAKNSTILVDIGQGLSIMVGLPTIASWDISERPKNAKAGTIGYNTETNNLEFFDGTSWFGATLNET